MRLLIKILLVIGIVFGVVVAIIGITIYQGIQIMSIVNDKTLRQDIELLMGGDCSSLPRVELKLAEAQEKVSNGCKNPIIKMIIEKKAPIEMQNICTEINNPENKINKSFAEIKKYCSMNKSA